MGWTKDILEYHNGDEVAFAWGDAIEVTTPKQKVRIFSKEVLAKMRGLNMSEQEVIQLMENHKLAQKRIQ